MDSYNVVRRCAEIGEGLATNHYPNNSNMDNDNNDNNGNNDNKDSTKNNNSTKKFRQ